MDLLHSFISIHLPTAKEEEYFSNSIVRYSGDKKIFVVGLGDNNGIITEQKKAEILKQLGKAETEVYFLLHLIAWKNFKKIVI